jgi:acetyl esterase/lipase
MRRPLASVSVTGSVCALALALLAGLSASACTSASPTTPPGGTATTATGQQGTASAGPLAAGRRVTVTYCNDQKARIIEPDALHGPAPAAVYVHGGSWISGNFDSGGFIINTVGRELATQGFVVVSLDYRLGPRAPWPAQIEDVKCAIRYLRANAHDLNIDPAAIGAWGLSAGGHLVALLGTAGPSAGWDVGAYPDESSKVQAVVDMAGPSDLLTLGDDRGESMIVQENFISLLGTVSRQQLGAALRLASPVTYVAPRDPPFLLLQSDNDETVNPQQTQELAWDLAANQVPLQLIMVHGAGHEFDQAGASPDQADIARIIVDYFTETLILHRTPDAHS